MFSRCAAFVLVQSLVIDGVRQKINLGSVKTQAATIIKATPEKCMDGKFGLNFCSEWCNTAGKWGCGVATLRGRDGRNTDNEDYTCLCDGCNGCPETAVTWIKGGPGQNCIEACEENSQSCAGDKWTSPTWNGWPEDARSMTARAARAGITCTSTEERCDMGEAPLYQVKGVSTICQWCKTAGSFRAEYMPRCENKFQNRTRICPCMSG